jgi:hypothetical protein
MTEAPKFFVPAVADANKYEEVFEALAKLSGLEPPPADRRIYSITFVHDGEEWTATVGERMRGIRLPNPRSRSKKPTTPQPLFDQAVVMAIFPGSGQFPHRVLTNGARPSKWENPFMARAKSMTYFAKPEATERSSQP